MAFVDVITCCLDSIRNISEHVEGSLVYLDAGCTECFQFLGAFPLLLELGACAVCSLENISSFDTVVDWNSKFDRPRKIVVMTSRLLSDAHRYILHCLSTHQNIYHCTIFTSISEAAHSAYPDSPLGPDAFHEYESLLVQDYEELMKRGETKSRQSGEGNLNAKLTLEDEGWSQLTSSGEDMSHYEDYPMGYAEDLGQKLVVSVHHFPLILCPFSPRVFVLPSEGSVAEAYLSAQHEDSLSPGLPPLSTGFTSDGDDISPGATLTAQFLYHLAAKMDLKMEIFSLGDVSKIVGKLLTDMSSLYDVGRRKRSAGLLLIDRSLDLLTPCCHGDSLVDRMFSSLPRRERISSSTLAKGSKNELKHVRAGIRRAPLDVQIPLDKILGSEYSTEGNFQLLESIEAFLCGWKHSDSSQISKLIELRTKLQSEKSCHSKEEIFSGSLVSAEHFKGTPYLEALLERRTKDGTILVKKWLQETLRRENETTNVKIHPGSATKLELQPMIKALAKSESSLLRNKGIIQLAAATLYALDELQSSRWDAFIGAEKILNVNAGDTTSQSLAAQISDLINKSALVGSHGQMNGKMEASQGLLSFEDALLLTITGYLLAGENFPTSGSGGPFSWQEEHFLKEAIVDAILENPAVAKLKFLHGLTEELEANLGKIKSGEAKVEPLNQSKNDDFDDDQWGNWGDEDTERNISKEQTYDDVQLKLELRDRVDNLFKFLHKLSSLNKRNLPMREGTLALDSNFDGDYPRKGLLYKLLTRVLHKYDIPGLEYHSSTVGRIFKSGFGRFGLGHAKPSLADHSFILVFIIGGINGVEVREAQEAFSESGRPDTELILGGTTLLTPNDIFDLLLGNSSYI